MMTGIGNHSQFRRQGGATAVIRLGKLTPDLMNRAARAVAAAAEHPAAAWYSIYNRAGDNDEPATLDIYGEIGFWGVTAQQFNDDLRSITARKVDMRISSPGGDVFDAIAIYNLIRSHPAHFTARVDGLAASAASVIIQAADDRVMMPHSQQMVHKAWAMTIGNADDHAETIALLNTQDDVIASIYHERTKGGQRKLEKIKEAMKAETWYTDEQAVAFGIADRVEKMAWQSDPPEDEDGEDGGDDSGNTVPDTAADNGNEVVVNTANAEAEASDEEHMAFAMLSRQLSGDMDLEALVR